MDIDRNWGWDEDGRMKKEKKEESEERWGVLGLLFIPKKKKKYLSMYCTILFLVATLTNP